ncbi:hypothetical protein PAXRUDRAFT_716197 [Paxillus rubicundulus Ve08.2h10]|uniref:Uncharacterized protein n=1 Tax=Paxillus rubicundulus Ve08.2h10 TaxID=930991 RepID=A0A0D0DKY1_9AGAM|nr:hypothetical protein PAXRUDRAFT_716197 [Paxillus rubicundulus Ve08.2h10]
MHARQALPLVATPITPPPPPTRHRDAQILLLLCTTVSICSMSMNLLLITPLRPAGSLEPVTFFFDVHSHAHRTPATTSQARTRTNHGQPQDHAATLQRAQCSHDILQPEWTHPDADGPPEARVTNHPPSWVDHHLNVPAQPTRVPAVM